MLHFTIGKDQFAVTGKSEFKGAEWIRLLYNITGYFPKPHHSFSNGSQGRGHLTHGVEYIKVVDGFAEALEEEVLHSVSDRILNFFNQELPPDCLEKLQGRLKRLSLVWEPEKDKLIIVWWI